MSAQRDWIATEIHDVRFYEYTNRLLVIVGKWLSIANATLFIALMLFVYLMPLKDSYYITSQNGAIKPIKTLTKAEINARVAVDKIHNQPIKHQ